MRACMHVFVSAYEKLTVPVLLFDSSLRKSPTSLASDNRKRYDLFLQCDHGAPQELDVDTWTGTLAAVARWDVDGADTAGILRPSALCVCHNHDVNE